jgi:hypothetical protein
MLILGTCLPRWPSKEFSLRVLFFFNSFANGFECLATHCSTWEIIDIYSRFGIRMLEILVHAQEEMKDATSVCSRCSPSVTVHT